MSYYKSQTGYAMEEIHELAATDRAGLEALLRKHMGDAAYEALIDELVAAQVTRLSAEGAEKAADAEEIANLPRTDPAQEVPS